MQNSVFHESAMMFKLSMNLFTISVDQTESMRPEIPSRHQNKSLAMDFFLFRMNSTIIEGRIPYWSPFRHFDPCSDTLVPVRVLWSPFGYFGPRSGTLVPVHAKLGTHFENFISPSHVATVEYLALGVGTQSQGTYCPSTLQNDRG